MMTYERVMRAINAEFLPTDEQRVVIESTHPVIQVIAGAGSGKTATMSNRIAYQVAMGNVRPDEVLGLTFTRKAAGELSQRVDKVLERVRAAGILKHDGRTAMLRPHIATYNSFASDIASTYGLFIGQEPGSRLITDAERWQLMAEVVHKADIPENMPVDKSVDVIIKTALTLADGLTDNDVSIGKAEEILRRERDVLALMLEDKRRFTKKNFEDLLGVVEEPSFFSQAWKKLKIDPFDFRLFCLPLVEQYFALKKRESLVEFSDQIATARKVVEHHPQIGQEISSQYRLVLFDEYQDTSVGQARFLRHSLGNRVEGVERSVCAVGDPNQAIYGWRGASANALADYSREFSSCMGEQTEILSLSISFRSDQAILKAANAVSGHISSDGVEVQALRARNNAGVGRVSVARPLMRRDSYRSIAWRIKDVCEEVRDRGENPEVAVLCRTHAWEQEVAHALEELNIPYEILGGTSLIERPEICTVRAALGVVVNPNRNDYLLRLLHHWAIGSDDLRSLHRVTQEKARQDSVLGLDSRREQSLVETTLLLDKRPEDMSEEGYSRLMLVREILDELSQAIHVPLPDLLTRAITLLGLDVAAASRGAMSQRVRTTLDSFITLGRDYALAHPGCSLRDFLEWLNMVDEHERLGEGEVGEDLFPEESVEVHPGVVQIMTMHAAKGLEWKHLVAIPEVTENGFDEKRSRFTSWITNGQEFPYPLRMDRADLPHFLPSEHEDKFAAAIELRKFLDTDLPRYENQERRRLAYVAFTRPTEELLLASYAWKDENTEPPLLSEEENATHLEDSLVPEGAERLPLINGEEKRSLLSYSTYLKEINESVEVTALGSLAGDHWPEELRLWWGTQANTSQLYKVVPSLFSGESEKEKENSLKWPRDAQRELDIPESSVDFQQLERAAQWLIQTRKEDLAPSQPARPYVTATDVVAMSADPGEYAKQAFRPIPHKPSRAARTGTDLHARIASYFQSPAVLDIDSVMEGGEKPIEGGFSRAEGEKFFDSFEKTRWATMPPIAIERSLSVVVEGKIVKCTIDAVFDTSSYPDLPDVMIIDWKTGARPNKEKLEARELQLALYRLAWSATHNVPLEDIGACFVYLGEPEGRQEIFAGEYKKEKIIRKISAAIEKGEANF